MINSISSSSTSPILFTESEATTKAYDEAVEILGKAGISTTENQETLRTSKSSPEVITQALEALYKADLLNQKNLNILFALERYNIGVETIICLNDANILTQENLKLLRREGPELEDMLYLKRANLLTHANFRLLAKGRLGDRDRYPILYLEELDIILTQKIIDGLARLNGDLDFFYNVIEKLEERGLVQEFFEDFLAKAPKIQRDISDLADHITFTEEIFSALLALEEFSGIYQIIALLKAAKLATEENIEAFLKALAYTDAAKLIKAMEILQDRDLLDQENLDSLFVKNGADPRAVAWGLYFLTNANILTRQNRHFFLVGDAAKVNSLAQGIRALADGGILSEATFPKLFATQNGECAKEIGEYLVQCYLAPRACQGTFRVRLSDLQSNPVEVLQKWYNLPKPPETIQFLTDGNVPLPESGASELAVQFYAQLVENLFKEGVVFSSIDPETGMPANADFDAHKETIRQIGALFGYMYDHKLIFGNILPKEFFSIPAIVKCHNSTLSKQKAVVNILKIGATPLLQDWLEQTKGFGKNYSKIRTEVCNLFSEMEEDFDPRLPDKALRKKANEEIQQAITPYVEIARALLLGISSWRLYADLQPTPESALEISYHLQGTLDANEILGALRPHTNDPNMSERIQWIKDRIFEENLIEDSTWNKRFVSLVTGQKALKDGDTIEIYISTNDSFSVQPRFGALFIPSSSLTKEVFFEKLEELMNIA